MARLLQEKSAESEGDGRGLRSPTYLAPEQVEGQTQKIGPPTDVYGLGAILYKLLTGVTPFVVDTLQAGREQVLLRAPVAPSQLQSNIPVELDAICLKCLEKESDRRYVTALELAEVLRGFRTATTAERSGNR
jgi:serine/threonine protein kinase